jgi:hypothetical protein
VQVLFTAIDDSDLPDQQDLGGVLQMRLIGALKVMKVLISGGFPS